MTTAPTDPPAPDVTRSALALAPCSASSQWPKGLRRLRVGEHMAEGDFVPHPFGWLEPLPDNLVGARVLGVRDGEDIVFRPRQRRKHHK